MEHSHFSWHHLALHVVICFLIFCIFTIIFGPYLLTLRGSHSLLYKMRIPLHKTGSQVCGEIGQTCIGVSTAKVKDENGKYYGYMTPNCDSQVVEAPHEDTCAAFNSHYGIDNIRYVKAADSQSSRYLGSSFFCSKDEKQYYDYVYCADE